MKKSGKILSLFLVLVMMVSVFAGINLYYSGELQSAIADDDDDDAGAESVVKIYKILEIVPNMTMAQIGYLVGHNQEPVDMTANWEDYKLAFSRFGSYNETKNKYKSKKLFEKAYLPATDENGATIKWDITVNTQTPSTLTQSDLDDANLIVISQSVDPALPTDNEFNKRKNSGLFTEASYDYTVKDFMDNSNFSWKKAMMIFKRIAGASGNKGTHPNFMIDFSMYSNATTKSFKYLPYYASTNMTAESDLPIVSSNGSKQNAYKLYLMLTSMNPSTFYGLYYNLEETLYGIDEQGYLHGRYNKRGSDVGSWVDFNMRYEYWSSESLKPYFMCNNNGELDSTCSLIGYNPVTAFTEGENAKRVDGGIVFRYGDGIAAGHENIFDSISTDDVLNGDTLDKYYKLYTGSFNVLCIDFYDKTTVNNSMSRNIINAYGNHNGILGGVHVENMSLSRFSGTKDDILEKYDALYFASGISVAGSKIAYTFNGGNVVSTSGPDRKWMALSESVFTLMNSRGWSNDTNFKGHDISSRKLSVIESFISKGKPVIIGKKLKSALASSGDDRKITNVEGGSYKDNGNKYYFDYTFTDGGTYKIKTNTNYSKIFLNDSKNLKSSVDAFYVDSTDDGNGLTSDAWKELVKAMQKDHFELVLTGQPATYYDYSDFQLLSQNGGVTGVTGVGDPKLDYTYSRKNNPESVYINTSNNGNKRKLTYSLYIDDSENTNYTLNLYLDMNGDGRFSSDRGKFVKDENGTYFYDNEGELFATKTINSKNGQVQSITFNEVDSDSTNGVLPHSYVGAVTWKLEIVKGSKSSAVIGYSACRAESTKARINVLQIVSVDTREAWGGCKTNPFPNCLDSSTGAPLLLPMKSEINAALGEEGVPKGGYDSLENMEKLHKMFSGYLTRDVRQDYNNASNKETITWNNNSKMDVAQLANAAEYYYMLYQQKDYDVNVLRLSTREFEDEMKKTNSDVIRYDSTSGLFEFKDPDPKSSHDWVKTNLLVMGFGEYTSDIVNTSALNALEGYFAAGNPAFVGRGIVRPYKTGNNITSRLSSYLGIDSTYTYHGDRISIGNQGPAEAKITEYATMCRYPLAIPSIIKSSASNPGFYTVDLSDDDVTVFLSMVNANNGANLIGCTTYDEIENNYLIYKKGNITFCAIGQTQANAYGQKADTFKLPEAGIIVNAIIGSQQTPPGEPAKEDVHPDFVVTDPGATNYPEYVTVPDPEDSTKTLKDENGDDVKVKVNNYSIYCYIDALTTKTNDSQPLGSSNGGDIESKNKNAVTGDNDSGTYTCKPLTFKVTSTEGASSDVSVFFQLGDSTKINEAGKVLNLLIKDKATGATVNNGELVTDKEYEVYIPLDNDFYKKYGKSNYGLIGSGEEDVMSYMDLKIFTNSQKPNVSGQYNDDVTSKSNLRIAVRGIFLID